MNKPDHTPINEQSQEQHLNSIIQSIRAELWQQIERYNDNYLDSINVGADIEARINQRTMAPLKRILKSLDKQIKYYEGRVSD